MSIVLWCHDVMIMIIFTVDTYVSLSVEILLSRNITILCRRCLRTSLSSTWRRSFHISGWRSIYLNTPKSVSCMAKGFFHIKFFFFRGGIFKRYVESEKFTRWHIFLTFFSVDKSVKYFYMKIMNWFIGFANGRT